MRLVAQVDIPKLWPYMLPELSRLYALYPDHAVHPDVILARINGGQYAVLVYEAEGFGIVEADGEQMFVVVMAAFGGVTQYDIRDIISHGNEFAKQQGFLTVGFGSPRPGWLRVLKGMGFQREGSTYIKDLYAAEST